MLFPSPLISGRLIKRYKRFLADIVLDDGTQITAHCANPGSMMGVAPEGARVWVSRSSNKARKLPFSWELVEINDSLIAINTSNPNKIGAQAIEAGMIPELSGYKSLRREVKYGENSRIDILLEDGPRAAPTAYVEIKNVHLMREPGLAEFPDSVTSRGAKHLRELALMTSKGFRAVMLYIVQRNDCERFSLARDLDPAYASAFDEAVKAGVDVMCYDCEISTSEVTLRRAIPLDL